MRSEIFVHAEPSNVDNDSVKPKDTFIDDAELQQLAATYLAGTPSAYDRVDQASFAGEKRCLRR
ncbi:MAG: hypothetical protein ACI9UK_001617 [Candidatus Krumholzibacteriia bacterium]